MTFLSNPLSIVLTETHLSDSVLSAEVSIPGYALFRSDRESRTHGGTCIYVRNDLATQVLACHSNSVCETLVLKVKTLDLILVSVYRPPDSSLKHFREAIDICKNSIDKAMEQDPKLTTILQLGDYNFPFISWPSKSIYKDNQANRQVKDSEKEQAELLISFMYENFIENFCFTPTRGQNILDLILCNNPGLVGQIYTLISKGISDHNLLELCINHPYTRPQDDGPREVPYINKFHQYDLLKADEEDWMRYKAELMDIDFDTATEGRNVEEKLCKMYEILEKATALIFIKKKEYIENEEEEKEENEKKKVKNNIPKNVRLLMRQKHELSERIKKSNHRLKTLRLTKQLEAKEVELSEKYKERKLKLEKEALGKIKKKN